MKNKKFLTLVLALVMVLGSFTSVFAAATTTSTTTEEVKKVTGRDNKIQYLVDNKYVEGRKVNEDPKNNDLALDKNLKRSEITKLLVYAIGRQDLAEKVQGAMKVYSDVETTHWANGVITVGTTMASPANAVAMLNGYPDGTFKPERDVTYAELAKMLVVLVKKDLTPEMAKNAIWASSWLTWAAELGILEDVVITDSNKAVTRADAFVMMYNALYTMKYIKKMPANETMGILSQLKNNKLTLNQGAKEKTFTITNDTTFVLYNQGNTLDVNADVTSPKSNQYTQAVKVSAINNPSFYYGSLVRVLTDANGNVTHILELGNPRFLALGHEDENKWEHGDIRRYFINPNNRWKDIADATVETRVRRDWGDDGVRGIAAKINYDGGAAKSIDFVLGNLVKPPVNATGGEDDPNNFQAVNPEVKVNVRLTSATKYFVADVRANQLTEVDNVDEAIRILGLTRASNWFFDVYAGYDIFGDRDNHETSANTNLLGYNEAKVVVFNSVQKGNNAAQLLRVKNESTSKYDITFENTKGEEIVNNLETYRNNFPHNFNTRNDSAKFDVVEYTVNNAFGIEAEMKIDHSNRNRYPIVKVTDVQGRALIVEGEGGETAVLYLDTDYDQFLVNQTLKGAIIQFHTLADNKLVTPQDVEKTNKVDIVSILPSNMALEGRLLGVVEANQKNQSAGKFGSNDITDYGTEYYKVIVKELNAFYNNKQLTNTDILVLNKTEGDAVKAFFAAYPDYDPDTIRFKVRDYTQAANHYEMYDLEVLFLDPVTNTKNWELIRYIAKDINVQTLVNELNQLAIDVPVAINAVGNVATEMGNTPVQAQNVKAKINAIVAQYNDALAKLAALPQGINTPGLTFDQADVNATKDAINTLIANFNQKLAADPADFPGVTPIDLI